jgi:putative membrane protein
MRTDHTSLNGTLTDLLARLDLDAEEAPAGVALRESSFPRRARLARLRGSAFDAAYVADDLTSHHELLDLVDRVLVPNAARRELREYLAALRPALAAHLAHAEQLAATLAARQR